MSDSEPDPDTVGFVIGLLAEILLLVFYVLTAAAHTALTEASESKLRKAAANGDRKAEKALALLEDESRFTLRIRTAKITLLCLIAGIASVCFLSAFGGWIATVTPAPLATTIAAVISLFLFVWLTVTLGEAATRKIANVKADTAAPKLAGFAALITALAAPMAGFSSLCARPLCHLFGLDPKTDVDVVTEEEILQMVDEGEEMGVIEGSQKEMINNIFEFDDTAVDEVMTPRTDVKALDADDPIEEALRLCTEEGYSRLPLFEEDIDHILGVLYVKDLLPYVGQPLPASLSLRQLMRETYFVPETKRCGELFAELTEMRVQMAVVVDEYGGVAGIVTMEDLLESIVGNIQDEFDNEEEEITQTGENLFEVDGSAAMEELCDRWAVVPPEGDYDTVGGFILDELGRIPEKHEHPVVTYRNLTLTVSEMEDRRIGKVQVLVTPIQEDLEE